MFCSTKLCQIIYFYFCSCRMSNLLIQLEYERKNAQFLPKWKRTKQQGMIMAEQSAALKRSNTFCSNVLKYKMMSIQQEERDTKIVHNKSLQDIDRLKKSLEKTVSPSIKAMPMSNRQYRYS